MKMPTRWSYSSLSTYESCPKQFYFSYIEGLPSKESQAMARGSRLHESLERYMKGQSPALPWECKRIAQMVDGYRIQGAKAEEVWLLDKDWKPVEDQRDAWVKAIVDLHILRPDMVLDVTDYKSGREYDNHRSQLELYAIIGLIKYPEAKRAEYKAMYIDGGYTGQDGSIIRDFLPHKVKSWNDRAIRIFEDKQFLATPGPKKCQRCDYNRKNGGPCLDGV